jgi:hypothetical protein
MRNFDLSYAFAWSLAHFMFPETDNSPSEFTQCPIYSTITQLISFQLGLPIVAIVKWCPYLTHRTFMPKTAIDKNGKM